MPDAGGAISNGPTQAMLYDFIDRETKIDESIEQAAYNVRTLKKTKKDLRALIVASGFDLEVYDDTRKMMAQSFEEREAKHQERMRNMAWMGMPLGTQKEMFPAEEVEVPAEIQISRVQRAGRDAGKIGRERSSNPWPAGQLLYQTWDMAWLEGAELAAQSTVDKPKRGRPRKTESVAPTTKANGKGRGKNKQTAEPQQAPPPPSDLEFDTETEGSA